MDTARLQAGPPLAIIVGTGDPSFQAVAEVIARSGYVAFVPFAYDPAVGSVAQDADLAVFQRQGGETEILAAYRQLQGRPALIIVEGDRALLAAGFGRLPEGPHSPRALEDLLTSLLRPPAADLPPASPPAPAPAATGRGRDDPRAGPMPAPAAHSGARRVWWLLLAALLGLIILAGGMIALAGQPGQRPTTTAPGPTQPAPPTAAAPPRGQPIAVTMTVAAMPAEPIAATRIAGPTATLAGPLPHVGQAPRRSEYFFLIVLGLLASFAGVLILFAGARGRAVRSRHE